MFCNKESSEFDRVKLNKQTINIQADCYEFCHELEPFIETKMQSQSQKWLDMIDSWKNIFLFDKFYMNMSHVIHKYFQNEQFVLVIGDFLVVKQPKSVFNSKHFSVVF